MYRSLFLKEWIKTRRLMLLLGIVFAAVTAYIFLNIVTLFRAGAVPLWGTIIENDLTLVSLIRYLPGIAGMLFAIVQFAPEMQYKRLKLTLHLPLKETKIIGCMLVYGLVCLSLLFVLACIIIPAGISFWFSKEIVAANFMKMLPWFLGGYAAYLSTAWICFEPVWLQRILNALPAACIVSFFYIEAPSGAYIPFLYYLVVVSALLFFFSFHSVARFKNGVQ